MSTTENAMQIIDKDMLQVEQLLSKTVTDSKIEKHVNEMCQYVVSAGGKRLRPRLVLTIARALPSFKEEYLSKAYDIATSLELLHTATLVHDDVIDVSPVRRGQPTLHEIESNHIAVLTGDYLFTKCFLAIETFVDAKLILSINRTLSKLVAGEIFQLEHQGDLNISIEEYENIIYCKTGALFELCSYTFADHINEDANIIENLKTFGRKIGSAFQIVDDILDYTSDSECLGKSIGEDLEDKRITLPLILTLNSLDNSKKEDFIKAFDDANLDKVIAYMKDADAFNKTKNYAKELIDDAKKCLDILSDSSYKQLLLALCDKIIDRKN